MHSRRFLDRVSVIGGALACAINLILIFESGGSPSDYLPVGLLGLGLVLSRFLGAWGLLPTLIGAVFAILQSGLQAAGWIVVFSQIFSLALRGGRGWLTAPLTGVVLYVTTVLGDPSRYSDPTAYMALSTAVAAAATGYAIRTHESYLDSVRDRVREAISSRDVEITRRLAEERLQIARDLHDVVGHEIAVIGMNLGVIDVGLTQDSRERVPLMAAQDAVGHALQETQRILGVLRRGDPDTYQSLTVATAERIPDLVRVLSEAGVQVDLAMPVGDLDIEAAVSVTAYRIAQEALTNAHRHGRGGISVTVLRARDLLEITVENDIATRAQTSASSGGYGLVGMRERVAAAGGKLRIDPGPPRFVVRATLRADGGDVS